MRVTDKITIYAGMDATQNIQNVDKQQKENQKTIFAGSLNENILHSNIEEKKKQAQEKALKVVKDAWDVERSIDKDLQTRRDHIAALKQENKEAQASINEIEARQEQLKVQYGITDDSQEEKDLDVLRRKRDLLAGRGGGLTQEEFMYAAKLEKEGLTEYQQRQLELHEEKSIYQITLEDNKRIIKEEIAVMEAISLERLKNNTMVKAQKQAEAIKDAASQEIIGMVVEAGKEHIDEQQKEREEEAEKIEEKQEQQEEFIEAQKERKKEQEELLEDVVVEELLQLNQTKADVQAEVQDILNKMKLVAEDVKGAMVDEEL